MTYVIRRMDRKKWILSFLFRELLLFFYFLIRGFFDFQNRATISSKANLWWVDALMAAAFFIAILYRLLSPPSKVLEFNQEEVRIFSRFGSPVRIPRSKFSLARIATFEDAINDGDFLGGLALDVEPTIQAQLKRTPGFQYHLGPTNALILNPSFMTGEPSDWAKVFNGSCPSEA